MIKAKYLYLSIILIIIVLSAGFYINHKNKEVTLKDYEKINLELIIKERSKEGILYSIKLINGSDFVIEQNNVYVSFPIKTGELSSKGNDYKIEAKGNKLDIQPGDVVTLDVYMPFEGIGDISLLEVESPNIQLIGYLDKVDNKHRFNIGGDLIQK